MGNRSLFFLWTLPLEAAVAFSVGGICTSGAPIPHGNLELIAENQWIAAGQTLNLGLHFQLEKGWHIYWINPGDSGEPPRVKWQLPAGLVAGAIEWPTPRRLGTASIVDYGYEDTVTLIVPIHAEAHLSARQTAELAAEVRVLVCREMCIPGKAQLSLTLPIRSQPPPADLQTADLFASTVKALPRPAPKNWKISIAEANESLVLTVSLGRSVTQAVFFPLVASQIDNAAPQKLQPTDSGFQLSLRKSDQLLQPIDRLKGVLVVPGGPAYWMDVPVGKLGAKRIDRDTGVRSAKFRKEG